MNREEIEKWMEDRYVVKKADEANIPMPDSARYKIISSKLYWWEKPLFIGAIWMWEKTCRMEFRMLKRSGKL